MPATKKHQRDIELDSPVVGGEAVTPHDTNELTHISRALLLGADATLSVLMEDGQTLSLPLVKGWNPVSVKRVNSTGSDAGVTIVALW